MVLTHEARLAFASSGVVGAEAVGAEASSSLVFSVRLQCIETSAQRVHLLAAMSDGHRSAPDR